MADLLIVEDDTATNEAICEYMKSAGHTTLSAFDGEQGLQIAREKSVDLVILDIMLPKRTGLEVLKELRQKSSVPVLMLTALDDEPTQAASFDEEVDDYITKPFSLSVLRARVNTQLRKKNSRADSIFRDYGFVFDFERMQFWTDGTAVELSKTEQKLLRLLVEHRGQTLTREQLLDRVWDGGEFVDANALSVAVKRLRDKLTDAPLKTVYGLGYTWEEKR